MARETKIGIVLMSAVLIGVGYMVYQRVIVPRMQVAQQAPAEGTPGENPAGTTEAPIPDGTPVAGPPGGLTPVPAGAGDPADPFGTEPGPTGVNTLASSTPVRRVPNLDSDLVDPVPVPSPGEGTRTGTRTVNFDGADPLEGTASPRPAAPSLDAERPVDPLESTPIRPRAPVTTAPASLDDFDAPPARPRAVPAEPVTDDFAPRTTSRDPAPASSTPTLADPLTPTGPTGVPNLERVTAPADPAPRRPAAPELEAVPTPVPSPVERSAPSFDAPIESPNTPVMPNPTAPASRPTADASDVVVLNNGSRIPADRLGGYVPAETAGVRAVSRTVVRGNGPSPTPASPPSGLGPVAQADDPLANPPSDLSPVPRRAVPTPLEAPDGGVGNPGGAPRTTFDPRAEGESRLTPFRQPGSSRPAADIPVSVPASEEYVVQPNDNFWTISRKVYGTARYFKALTKYNERVIRDPQTMRPGLKVLTPHPSVLDQQFPDLIDKNPAAPSASNATSPATSGSTVIRPANGEVIPAGRTTSYAPAPDGSDGGLYFDRQGTALYKVGADDTLGSIAQRHLGRASRWAEIYEKNRDVVPNPNNLKIGTVLRLPADASRLSVVPEPGIRR